MHALDSVISMQWRGGPFHDWASGLLRKRSAGRSARARPAMPIFMTSRGNDEYGEALESEHLRIMKSGTYAVASHSVTCAGVGGAR